MSGRLPPYVPYSASAESRPTGNCRSMKDGASRNENGARVSRRDGADGSSHNEVSPFTQQPSASGIAQGHRPCVRARCFFGMAKTWRSARGSKVP